MFLLSYFAQGIEFTTILATLWSYVNGGLCNSNPALSYGLIASGRFIAPLLLGIVTARWFDRNRSMRKLMLTIILLMTLGYALYMVHYSPYIIMLATTLQGSSFILDVAINSEMIRVYSGNEVQRIMLFFLIAYSLGEITGPLIIKPLEKVNLSIESFHITYGNVAGLVLLTLSAIRLILAYFCTSDLSQEFDLKAHEARGAGNGEILTRSSTIFQTLKNSFTFDAGLLLVQQLYTGCIPSFVGRAFPLVIETLGYNNLVLDMCYIGASVCMTIASIIISATKPSSRGVYVCGIISIVTLLICHIVMFLIPMDLSEPVNVLLVITMVLTYALHWITDMTFMIVTLGKLFPSSVQSSIEGIRMLVRLVGSFCASLASVYVYKYFYYLFFVSAPVNLLFLGMMFLRRHVLSDPKVHSVESLICFNNDGLRKTYKSFHNQESENIEAHLEV